jgi:hypothetical protein
MESQVRNGKYENKAKEVHYIANLPAMQGGGREATNLASK